MKSLQFNPSFEAIALYYRTTQFRAVSIFHSQTSRRTDRTALACQLFHPKPDRGFVFRTLSGSTRSENNLLRLIFCMTNFSTRFCCHHQFVFCSAQLSPVSGHQIEFAVSEPFSPVLDSFRNVSIISTGNRFAAAHFGHVVSISGIPTDLKLNDFKSKLIQITKEVPNPTFLTRTARFLTLIFFPPKRTTSSDHRDKGFRRVRCA